MEAENSTLAEDLFGAPSPPPATVVASAQVEESGVDGEQNEEEAELDDLFGGDDDDDDDNNQMQQDGEGYDMEDGEGITEEEQRRRNALEYGEDDNLDTVDKVEVVASVDIVNFAIPAGGRVWHARLPHFLSINSTPFDEATWEPEVDEEEKMGVDGAAPGTPGGPTRGAVLDENVIRWKWGTDEHGNPVKQSNSRIVRWDDGSLSLQIGSELFDISTQLETGTSPDDPPLHNPLLKKADQAPASLSTFDSNRSHGLTYLTAKHEYAALSEAQASIHGTMTFRPADLKSNTHRRLATSIASRNVKARGTKFENFHELDPEKRKADREKEEMDRIKKAKKDSMRVARGTGTAGTKARRQTRLEGGDSVDEDEDDDMYASNTGAGSRSQPKRGRGGPLNQEDDEEEDDEGFVVSDGEEGEEGAKQSDGEDDEMDERERRIEREEKKRRERRKEQREVSSEEEPAEPTMGVKRRLVVESDEDDE